MPETQAKNHHLIPRTYMTPWANHSGTLMVEFLSDPGNIVSRNKEKIAGITDYYSIKAGMPMCTKADTERIFSAVSNYHVKINGVQTTDTLEMNKKFYDFDNWEITRQNGTKVSKRQIKQEIKQVKIKDIETNWSIKYENNWSSVVQEIEGKVLNTTASQIPSFQKEYLMKFFVALNWRGFHSNEHFENAYRKFSALLFDDIDIPFGERDLPCLETAHDELRHDLLLRYYRQFLEDKGVIYEQVQKSLQYTGISFLISDGPTLFNASDSPSFVFKRNDGTNQGIMPITPRILLVQRKWSGQNDSFYIHHISDEEVQRYNAIIQGNAVSYIIHAN